MDVIIARSPMVGTTINLVQLGRERKVVAGGSCSSVTEHWHSKLKTRGFDSRQLNLSSSPIVFQMSTDSNAQIRS